MLGIEQRVLEAIDFEEFLLQLAEPRGLVKSFPYLYTMLSSRVRSGKAETSSF